MRRRFGALGARPLVQVGAQQPASPAVPSKATPSQPTSHVAEVVSRALGQPHASSATAATTTTDPVCPGQTGAGTSDRAQRRNEYTAFEWPDLARPTAVGRHQVRDSLRQMAALRQKTNDNLPAELRLDLRASPLSAPALKRVTCVACCRPASMLAACMRRAHSDCVLLVEGLCCSRVRWLAEDWPAAPSQSMSTYSQGVLGGPAGASAAFNPAQAAALGGTSASPVCSSAGSVHLSGIDEEASGTLSDAENSVYGGGRDAAGSAIPGSDGASAASAEWRERRRALRRPREYSARDRFLLQECARSVFTMQAWQAQTVDLMQMQI
jgi:hypothetical protein